MKLKLIPTIALIFGTSLGWSSAAGQSQPSTKTQATPTANTPKTTNRKTAVVNSTKEQIMAEIMAFDKSNTAYMKKVRAEKDVQKKIEMSRNRPSPSKAINKIIELAKQNPKAEGVEQGLVWALRGSNNLQLEEISNLLLTHYDGSGSIARLTYLYSRKWNGGAEGLRQIIKRTSNEKIRRLATYHLGSKLVKRDKTKEEGLALLKKLQETPDIKKTNPALLKEIKKDIFITEHLSVGCEAPDIVGTDHEDKTFKLSDYRGKVVLLDFWGYW